MRKKQDDRKQGNILLTALIAAALFCVTPPAQAAPILNDGTPDRTNMINQDLTINSGETVTTWSGTKERPNSVKYNGNILINSGGIWRPMDAKAINVYGSFELDSGALLDLSYKYGENYPDNPWGTYDSTNLASSRNFLTYGTTILHDGSIIRLNVGGGNETANLSDKLVFNNLQLAADETAATVRLQIRYNKNTGGLGEQNSTANFWDSATASVYSGTINELITINNLTETIDDNLNFSAETYYMDSSLNKYLFAPTLTSVESTYEGVTTKNYNLDWTATRTDLVSQGVFSAANAQLSMRNLWRMEDGLFWKRGEELRAANRLGQSGKASGTDGAWAQIWRGQYDFAGAYGSDFSQSYNGIQVGYDKQREGNLFGGKVYTGLFLSMLNSNADFHQHTLSSGSDEALYSSSAGDLKSGGIGLYTTWVGDKGHYLDFTVRGSKLSNNYKYFDSDDSLHENDYGTWAYGAGLRYGYQKELPGGWFVEPQAGLSYGTVKGYSYTQDNNMRYNQEEMKMLLGRFGVTAGRNFTTGDRRGTVYAKVAVNHDFQDGGKANAEALTWNKNLNGGTGGWEVGATLPMNTLAGKDTWYEFALGTTLQTGKGQNAFVELTKTTGGKVNTDWQVNAGMSWRFNGPSSVDRADDRSAALDRNMTALEKSLAAKTVSGSQATIAEATGKEQADEALPNGQTVLTDTPAIPATTMGGDSLTPANTGASQAKNTISSGQAGQVGQTEQSNNTSRSEPVSRPVVGETAIDSSEPGSFTLAPLVVEAQRPDWEKKLSPGTVSVIHVPEYKGEMKNLPDLLQTVPGVYVQRLQGTGHYTVARVRGSTGGEVNIYVDGVLVNSNADAAVDLSTIPIENVERIEVYRGYVPARFAGSPLGGAINIITKKPTDTKGSITTGMRSFNGYTGNLELTAPAGSGSLLFALNRDQAKGDFKYDHFSSSVLDAATGKPWTVTRNRLNNDYQNTDALLKWQDDNWFAKLTYKKNSTSLPESAMDRYADAPIEEIDTTNPNWSQYRQRQLDTTKTEFLLGRRQTAGNLEWGWKLGTSYQLKQAASSQYKAANGNYFLTLDNEFRNRRYEGAIDGSWKVWDNHVVEFLFDYAKESMDVSISNPNAWPPSVSSVTSDMKYYKKYFVPHYDNHNMYFQVQDTMTLNRSGNLFFTPQFKAQKWDMSTLNQIGDPDIGRWLYSYGLALKKVQNEHWTFRGTYGTYHKFPNFYELFGDGVNVKSRWEIYRNGYTSFLQDSLIERGTSWDVSANWQGKALAADSDVTLTYFNRRSKNLSTYALDPYGFGYYSNLAAGKIQGVELESKMKWRRWDLLLAATWNDSLVTKSGKDSLVTKSEANAGNPFPWIPEWEYNVRLGYRFPGDKLSAFVEYHYLDEVGTARTYSDGNMITTMNESLGLTNVGLKYDFNKTIKLTAGINDLFNKGPDQLWHYYSPTATGSASNGYGNVQYPQQGRTYYATVQYFF
ncbi:TonB-dependent receptor domain-containing protein [Sporomusa acidovorans]|uniref:Vitamin B12 transporter BtuB n=1 Tax=Sporomusa acidovorans (strain ATCC 49682 / DSM 3132 / Mol) TaxID=1123286 RepID=A0ABZ3IZP2_SPOA4|nr:TonB-dependent receptor [Sporomusa acidovorans]OZC14161.1 serine protease pic autotransporter precursor [Sporomusa acidovorans DSM 3132]SDE69996.1 outer membrane autotransporter barrel domain-containing protein [Sporomusa acidovorans]